MPRKDSEFFRIFASLFVFVIDSQVYSPPRSWDFPVYSPQRTHDSPLYSSWGNWPKLVYKKNRLVHNTPASQDFPVIITPGSLDSLIYLPTESFFCKPVLMLVLNSTRSRLPGLFITGEFHSPVYSPPGNWPSSMYSPLNRDFRLLQLLRDMWFMFDKIVLPKGFLSTSWCIHHQGVNYEYK